MPNAMSTSHEPRRAIFFDEARFLIESRIPALNFIVARATLVCYFDLAPKYKK
jgi:hypothetical protein